GAWAAGCCFWLYRGGGPFLPKSRWTGFLCVFCPFPRCLFIGPATTHRRFAIRLRTVTACDLDRVPPPAGRGRNKSQDRSSHVQSERIGESHGALRPGIRRSLNRRNAGDRL